MRDIIVETLELIKISDQQRTILKYRYTDLHKKARDHSQKYSFYFNYGKMCIVVGTILIPALLSIEYVLNKELIFWITWSISLSVSILNGFFSLYKIDRNYYMSHTLIEEFCSEFWQYASLTGRYSGFYNQDQHPTHENQYVYFTNAIEKIQMRSIESSYGQLVDNLHMSNLHAVQSVVPPSVFKTDIEETKKEFSVNDIHASAKNTVLELNS